MERIENKIVKILNIQDEEERKKEFNIMFSEILDAIKGKNWNEKARILNNLDLDYNEKLKFLILGSYNRENKSFSMEVIPFIIKELIANNEEKFWELMNSNHETRRIYAEFLKDSPEVIKYNHAHNLDKILSLPEVKEKVLEDEEIIIKQFSDDTEFMENLPKEYGYLISLYKNAKDKDFVNMKKLYNKFYGDIITEEEQLEFINLQHDIENEPNVLKLSIKEKTKELLFSLKQILEDKAYYEKIKKIEEKTGITFEDSISFLYKYGNTRILEKIEESSEINEELAKKIKYLASENRVENAEVLNDLNQYSLEDLKAMGKERTTDFNSALIGGPTGNINKRVFKDGSVREIRRIDKDGENRIIGVHFMKDHEDGVKKIYQNDIDLEGIEKHPHLYCVEAVKKLSSMTFWIEGEQCFIYTPNDLTINQKLITSDWLKLATEDGVFGIFAYDKEKDEISILSEGEGKDIIKEKILNLGERVTEEQLEEYRDILGKFDLDETLTELNEIAETEKISDFDKTSKTIKEDVTKERIDEFGEEEQDFEEEKGW